MKTEDLPPSATMSVWMVCPRAGGLAIIERRAFLLKLDDDKRIEIAAIGYPTVGMLDDPFGDQTCGRIVPVN